MKIFQLLLFTITLAWSTIGSTRYQDDTFSISDFNSVPDAVASIKSVLEKQGMEIVGVIDHANNADNVGLELAPTQLILFRDPRLERKLFNNNATATIDLPVKILVFENQTTNKVELIYNPAGYLTDRHNLRIKDRFLSKMDNRLKQFGSLNSGLITIDSLFSVAETVDKLKTVLTDNGFFIPFTFDFNGQPYHPKSKTSTLIVFGNPNTGTLLMQNQQSTGLDLPQKLLIWEDSENQVHITYNDPVFLGKRHNLQGLDTLLGNIANRIDELAKEGASLK